MVYDLGGSFLLVCGTHNGIPFNIHTIYVTANRDAIKQIRQENFQDRCPAVH
ncbi:hypothetical protein PPL_12060 [Heterostelium album PN500]|uniref:Uncharacterized protein n=1 Tax=Heterostelium pallidum (strain ATCC 26659 / Pp 5 / PN500) TaxID=670386 RepID=D3BLK7_HETP5|nr:hypothetical protein PPL_12060 [Heterostelium album PN500]EFA77458.1 hypothetical protein PPL_12060 [Heterostelium album PN500]|eukprot:XP_020429586.1 hypothetical protein PPL_12060 [Heterostelium album PN500]